MTSTSHAVLVQLRKERRVYEDVMRARCLTSGEDYDTVTRLVEDFLKGSCWRLGVVSGGKRS
ncbi:hypothetical protein L916_11757 [Phytophthora nicotianae]|uniref:Uncharacterized protein n=1 Tax=Phytophthora nicotianae TaxID=4792 RepID=W2IQ77_PHYNI|nr:hypothetical protein L916_11757 [Phytophthora nicotianae]